MFDLTVVEVKLQETAVCFYHRCFYNRVSQNKEEEGDRNLSCRI